MGPSSAKVGHQPRLPKASEGKRKRGAPSPPAEPSPAGHHYRVHWPPGCPGTPAGRLEGRSKQGSCAVRCPPRTLRSRLGEGAPGEESRAGREAAPPAWARTGTPALAARAAGGSAGSSQPRGDGQVPTWPLITGADTGRFLALAAAALLLLAVVAADEPLSSPEPPSPAASQTPEPLANSEPLIAGKSESSGESEIASPVEQATTGGAPVSFEQADRSHTEEMNGDLLHSDASNLGSFSLDPLPGDAQSGPAMEEPSHSHESQESLDHEVDSEESLTSPGM